MLTSSLRKVPNLPVLPVAFLPMQDVYKRQVMDLNQISCLNMDILAGHAEILTWRLWQEILSNDAVETLEVIEKWDVEENSHFLVLDKDQDNNMTGIFIDGDGMIE